MTNKRKIQRFKRMQVKNSEERIRAEIRKMLKDNKKYLCNVPVLGLGVVPLLLHKPDKLRIEGLVNGYLSINEAFDEFKKRVEKELGGS